MTQKKVNVFEQAGEDAGSYESFGYKEEGVTESDLEEVQRVLSGDSFPELNVNYTSQYGLCGTAWVPLRDSAGKAVAIWVWITPCLESFG